MAKVGLNEGLRLQIFNKKQISKRFKLQFRKYTYDETNSMETSIIFFIKFQNGIGEFERGTKYNY